MQSLMILGRQPQLGIAELESLYGADKVQALGSHAALVAIDPCLLAFDRLGGSTKFCKHLTTLDTTNWRQIESFLLKVSPEHVQQMPDGKMTLGLSVIGLDVPLRQLQATGLQMKKVLKKTGRNVRLIPNKSAELNAAQVLHNKLTSPTGWELVFIKDGSKTVIAQTVKVQDIASYTIRDRERPKRDSRVGMLPPKLAQIIINLAVGKLPTETLSSICEIPAGETVPRPRIAQTILDPFCGTGVVLQEALLMGYDAYGTDINPRMIEYTNANIVDWLPKQYPYDGTVNLEVGDATSHTWQLKSTPTVACETYLGRPFTDTPSADILHQTASECNLIIKKFLQNLHKQLTPGTRLCIAVPAWNMGKNRFKHLPVLDQLTDLGYNRMVLERVPTKDLLYFRPDQVVARELVILIRK